MPHFEIHDERRVVFRVSSGPPLLSTRKLVNELSCLAVLASIRQNAGNPLRYVRRSTDAGVKTFELRDVEDECLGTSTGYADWEALERDLAVVVAEGQSAPVVVVRSEGEVAAPTSTRRSGLYTVRIASGPDARDEDS